MSTIIGYVCINLLTEHTTESEKPDGLAKGGDGAAVTLSAVCTGTLWTDPALQRDP